MQEMSNTLPQLLQNTGIPEPMGEDSLQCEEFTRVIQKCPHLALCQLTMTRFKVTNSCSADMNS